MKELDLVIVGAGPVGLMCAYLAKICGLRSVVVDKSEAPLRVGRADALNARTLQLLELAKLFEELYPQGKPCNTSSVWKSGGFVSRQSSWWENLQGCLHKHFLMIGQSFLEQSLDRRLQSLGAPVLRKSAVTGIRLEDNACITTLASGETLKSSFVIGADGSRSFVRESFKVPFLLEKPQIIWAVVDAEIETSFAKVPEIIVFQTETSDVAWIPREGTIDRFYVRMDKKEFAIDEALAKINLAMSPHRVSIKKLIWFSQFSVKESVAESFVIQGRIFLAGDACHIHSVNGGQGLNTGLSDAFNLIWKLKMVLRHGAPVELLRTYESERKPVALSVIETSGELVRSTKYSESGTHAQDYVKIVEKRSGNITGMGIRYPGPGLVGQRLHDFLIGTTRVYSLLDYSKYTLLSRSEIASSGILQTIVVGPSDPWPYEDEAVLVRPDSYIEAHGSVEDVLLRIERHAQNVV